MCIVDYFGVKSYLSLHLVRIIPKIQDIPQVLLLLTEISEKDPEKLGYSASFLAFLPKITYLNTTFPKYLGNSTHFIAKSYQI